MQDFIQTEYLPKGYLINSLGNVISPNGKTLKQSFSNSGYFFINIKNKGYFIHRAICFAFLEKINGKYFVNHINGIKTDNRIENLEWCTKSENTKHCYDNNLKKYKPLHFLGKKGFEHNKSKSIKCIETNKIYGSYSEAERELNLGAGSVSYSLKNNKKVKGCTFEKSE